MAITIYTQSDSETSLGEPATPAHFYTGTTDFSNILDDMARGNIPVNTGSPFPVVWKSDVMVDPNTPPWDQPVPIYGEYNPWQK